MRLYNARQLMSSEERMDDFLKRIGEPSWDSGLAKEVSTSLRFVGLPRRGAPFEAAFMMVSCKQSTCRRTTSSSVARLGVCPTATAVTIPGAGRLLLCTQTHHHSISSVARDLSHTYIHTSRSHRSMASTRAKVACPQHWSNVSAA